jgi:hypothetical protein
VAGTAVLPRVAISERSLTLPLSISDSNRRPRAIAVTSRMRTDRRSRTGDPLARLALPPIRLEAERRPDADPGLNPPRVALRFAHTTAGGVAHAFRNTRVDSLRHDDRRRA